MDIEAKGYTIQVSLNELWDLAFSVKRSLELSIKSHWVNYQDVWEKNEAPKLRLLKTMFNALGRIDIYEEIFRDVETIFNKFNQKK